MDPLGEYDFPPASSNSPLPVSVPTEQPSRGLPDVDSQVHHLRNLLNSERHRDGEERRRALNLLDRESREASADRMSERRYHRRRELERQARQYEAFPSTDPDTIPVGQSNWPLRVRRTATRPSERPERHRQRLYQNPSRPRQGADHSGNTEGTIFSGLPGRPVPRIGSPDLTAQEYSGEARVNMDHWWRAKRRKLDADDLSDGFKASSYGHRGQVVSGPLKMEMVSCDGGQYSEPSGASSWPGNVLQDDMSVYCTKSGRCNIVLRHQKGIPFSLRKLVVKAPKNGYDAPIQEGMVFVSSDGDHLLSRTARYQIQHSPEPYTRSRRHEYSQIRLQPSHEYFNSTRSPLRSIDFSSFLPTPFPSSQRSEHSMTRTPAAIDLDGGNLQNRSNTPQAIPGFQVTTSFDDVDSGSEDTPTWRPLPAFAGMGTAPPADYWRRYWHSFLDGSADEEDTSDPALEVDDDEEEEEDEDDDDEDDDDDDEGEDEIGSLNDFLTRSGIDPINLSREERDVLTNRYGSRLIRYRRSQQRRRLRRGPSRIEITANDGEMGGGIKGPDVLAPHARFFIREHKSCVSVRFDPPVAGKYILVKMWAASQDSNIDIQSIVAHGFAGPRYLPSRELQ